MSTTVIVAATSLLATLLGAGLGAYWQHRNNRNLQLLEARIRVYGECAASLYEFERVTYSRVKARLDDLPHAEREALRQEAYRNNSAARAAIGQLSVLSAGSAVPKRFGRIREDIGDLNDATDREDLKERHDKIYVDLDRVLEQARTDLTR